MNLERLLIQTANRAGQLLRDHAFNHGEIEWKKEGQKSPASDLDKQAEALIKEYILSRTEANFIGEEYGTEDNGARDTYIIDPIDGTNAWVDKEFLSTISIGVERDNKLIGGVVYDFMKDIMYVGTHGEAKSCIMGKNCPCIMDILRSRQG